MGEGEGDGVGKGTARSAVDCVDPSPSSTLLHVRVVSPGCFFRESLRLLDLVMGPSFHVFDFNFVSTSTFVRNIGYDSKL